MKEYKLIKVLEKQSVSTVVLNRPDMHNAFNDEMLTELTEAFSFIAGNKQTRVVVLTGTSNSFCSGGDINWMKKTQSYTHAENLKDAERLAEVLYLLFSLPQPTIARVNGPAYGGGVGLISVCDFAISVDTAKFKLSEVSLGLVPSVISPYLLKRIGEKTCRELFLTARFFTPVEAKEYGLLNDVVTNENLNSSMKNLINKLLSNSPNALASCKKLLAKLPDEDLPKSKISTANLLAHMRSSNEAQEGINAFFEKRKPNWHDEIQDYDI